MNDFDYDYKSNYSSILISNRTLFPKHLIYTIKEKKANNCDDNVLCFWFSSTLLDANNLDPIYCDRKICHQSPPLSFFEVIYEIEITTNFSLNPIRS